MSSQLPVLLAKLFTAYYPPGATGAADKMKTYAEFLHDIPEETMSIAIYDMIKISDRKFLPTIGEIREAANAVADEALGVPGKDDCWNYVCQHMCNDGPRSWDTVNEFAEECVRLMGGWRWLGQGLEADRPYRRREFMEIYDRQIERHRVERNRSAADAMLIEQMKAKQISGGNGKPQIGDGSCR